MAVNKNFVVKNGLEVNDDLLFADSATNKIGIGSTTPVTVLDVKGGIAGTDLQATGFTTLTKDLQVGASGSAFYVSNTNNLVGVGTSVPAYLMDIRSSVSTGQTALYVKGDMRVTGDINLDDLTIDDLKVTGVATFVGDGSSGLDSWIDIDYSGNTLTGGGTTVGIGSTVYFVDNAKAVFGAGQDLTIGHVGGSSKIENVTGDLNIVSSNNVKISHQSSGEDYAVFNEDGAVDLYHNGTRRFATTHGGVVVAGGSSITGISTVQSTAQNQINATTGALQVAGGAGIAKNLYVGGGAEVTGVTTITGTLDANGALDVDGHTELDDVNVAGASTFAGAVDINNSTNISSGLVVTSGATLDSAQVSDLTDNRVVIAGASGELEDSADLTFDGTTLAIDAIIDSNDATQSSSSTTGSLQVAGGAGIAKNLFVGGGVSVGAAFTVGSGIGITTILDQDDMAANSATALASQQSIKAYVDTQITAEDLDFAGDSGTGAVDLDSQSLTISGTASEIKTVASGQSLTISLPDDVIVGNGFTVTGIGSFLNDVKFAGSSGATGLTWDKSTDDLIFEDNAKAIFGTSSDGLEIYHDGSHSRIQDTGTGYLILNTNTGVIIKNGADDENIAVFSPDDACSLNFNAVKKFETGPAGVIVTGIATADGFALGDDEKITFGASEDFKIEHNSDENYIDSNSGHIYIRANVNDDEGDDIYIQAKSGENGIAVTHDGNVELYWDGTKKFETGPAGTITVGVSTADGFSVGDNEKYISGASDDLTIFHSTSPEASVLNNQTGEIRILNSGVIRIAKRHDATGAYAENLIVATPDQGVELHHNNVKKFETSGVGATVYGTGALRIPVGTTGERPTAGDSPANGDIRYNTTINGYEGYGNGAWGGLGGGTEIDNDIATTTATGISTFVKTDYRSAYFRLQITQGSAYQVGRYLLIHDGTTATLIEESAIATGSMLGTVTAAVSGSNVIIYINMGSSSSATITHIIDKITV